MLKQYICKYGEILGCTEKEQNKARKKQAVFYRHFFSIKNCNMHKYSLLYGNSLKCYSAYLDRYEKTIAEEQSKQAEQAEKDRTKRPLSFAERLEQNRQNRNNKQPIVCTLKKGIDYNLLDIQDTGSLYHYSTLVAYTDIDEQRFLSFHEKTKKEERAEKKAKARAAYTRTKFKPVKQAEKPVKQAEKKDPVAAIAFGSVRYGLNTCGNYIFNIVKTPLQQRIEQMKADNSRANTFAHCEYMKKQGISENLCIPSDIAAKRAEIIATFERASLETAFKPVVQLYQEKPYNMFIYTVINSNLHEKLSYNAIKKLAYGKKGNTGNNTAFDLLYSCNYPVNKEDYAQQCFLSLYENSLSKGYYEQDERIELMRTAKRAVWNYAYKNTKGTNRLDHYKKTHAVVDNEKQAKQGYIDNTILTIDNAMKTIIIDYMKNTLKLSAVKRKECLEIIGGIACGYTQTAIARYMDISQQAVNYRIKAYIMPSLLFYVNNDFTNNGNKYYHACVKNTHYIRKEKTTTTAHELMKA